MLAINERVENCLFFQAEGYIIALCPLIQE